MKEYGGYLPLELIRGKEFYNYSSKNMLRVNSGRTAINMAIRVGGFSKVYLPIYLCQSVSAALEKQKVEYEFYHIDRSFYPVDVHLKDNEVILWPNYFGIQPEHTIQRLLEQYENIILDNTQAFFCRPRMNAYNVYSCRKFFGVSDGAYLIHRNLPILKLPNGETTTTSLYLLKSREYSTNEGYRDSLINEARIEAEVDCSMSSLTKDMLSAIRYNEIIKVRNRNFEILNKEFESINLLPVPAEVSGAMVYPLLIKQDIRKQLIENHVFVSQWWKWVLDSNKGNSFENELAQYLIGLPIDQRYLPEDMLEIAKIVKTCLRERGVKDER